MIDEFCKELKVDSYKLRRFLVLLSSLEAFGSYVSEIRLLVSFFTPTIQFSALLPLGGNNNKSYHMTNTLTIWRKLCVALVV
jgi:hypothetical protein